MRTRWALPPTPFAIVCRRDQYALWMDVADAKNRIIFEARIFDVYEHEQNLDNGRFRNFSRVPLEHCVLVPLRPKQRPYKVAGRVYENYNHALLAMVEWINEQFPDARWHFAFDFEHVGGATVSFSFDAVEPPVMLKLMWG